LFATEIRWLLEEVNVDGVMKRLDRMHEEA